MKVLQLCGRVPWPPVDGGRIAMLGLARALQRAGVSVRCLALNPGKHRVDVASLPPETAFLRLEAIDVDTTLRLLPALRSVVSGSSYNVDRFRSAGFAGRLAAVLAEERPDLVQLESLFVVPYLPVLRRRSTARVVLRSLNVESEIWEGLARGAPRGPRRLLLRHLARRLHRYETSHLGRYDAIVPVTEADAATFRRLGATVPIHVAPVGFDLESFPAPEAPRDPRALCFLGSLDWRPNVEGLRWFLRSVWPLVLSDVPDARLAVAGSHVPDGLAAELSVPGVVFAGQVPDARAFVSGHAAMVVPLLSGGGMRVKIVEAMALGRAVVSTTVGATGIDGRNGDEILLADDPASFRAAAVGLLLDPERAGRLGANARRLAEERFSESRIGERLAGFYRELLGSGPPEGQDLTTQWGQTATRSTR